MPRSQRLAVPGQALGGGWGWGWVERNRPHPQGISGSAGFLEDHSNGCLDLTNSGLSCAEAATGGGGGLHTENIYRQMY